MSRPLLQHLAELGVGETACILGTGSHGESAWPQIPLEAWLVGVNGATEIPLPAGLRLHARMMFDTSAVILPYYAAYCKPSDILTIVGHQIALPEADYSFVTEWTGGEGQFMSYALRCDATVGGAALDMLRHCYLELGIPRRVYLCGLDFGGGYYFNGYRCQTSGVWGQLSAMNALIHDCQGRGMEIMTLSETELEVAHAD
jgi:hypothetical protein